MLILDRTSFPYVGLEVLIFSVGLSRTFEWLFFVTGDTNEYFQ